MPLYLKQELVESYTLPDVEGVVHEVHRQKEEVWIYILEGTGARSPKGADVSFFLYSPNQDKRYATLLFSIARMIQNQKATFWYRHTLSEMDSLDGTRYAGLGFFAPFGESNDLLEEMKVNNRFYIWVFPLTSEELRLGQGQGMEQLEDQLEESVESMVRSIYS